MNIQPRTQAAYWEPYVTEWRHSGLSQIQYCTQNDLSLHRFRYWRQRLEKMASGINQNAIIPIFQTTSPPLLHDDLMVTVDRLEFGSSSVGSPPWTITITGSIPFAVLQQIGQACAQARGVHHVQA